MASELETLMAIESSGQLNPIQKSRLAELRKIGSWGTETGEIQSPGSGGAGGGGMAGGGGSLPAFKFDWEAAEKEALQKLEPYYVEKLKEAGGDVERAKKLLEDDYVRGKRYREEDEKTQIATDTQTAKEETTSAVENLNRRGLLFSEMEPDQAATSSAAPYSQYAQKFELNPLAEKQQARRQAIQRAIMRQEEIAGEERKRGIEEQDIAFPRYKKALEEEKKEKATLQMAPLKYQRELTKYNATVGNSSYLQ